MKLLITGAGGFIGSALLERLRERRDFEVLAPRRAELDLGDAGATAAWIARHRPAAIVHLAASLARGEDERARAAQQRDTLAAGRNLLAAAQAAGIPHLIMAGTVEELGDAAGVLAPELPPAPLTEYGRAKAALLASAREHAARRPVRIDWFRPFTVYGPGQRGEMLIPYAFRCALEGKPAAFTDGLQRRDFLYIDDLVDWLILALEAPPAPPGVFIHHLGTGVGTPVAEVLRAIAEQFPGARFTLGARPRREGEPAEQIAPARAPGARNTRVDWRTGIARTADWWRAAAASRH